MTHETSMTANLSKLAAIPGLSSWLTDETWKFDFHQGTLDRSQPYISEFRIKQVQCFCNQDHRSAYASAMIRGSSPTSYKTDILFKKHKGAWTMESECSCPVTFRCKHAAALLAFLSQNLLRSTGQKLPPHQQPLTLELRQWLTTIENLAVEIPTRTAAKTTKPEIRFLAYCIEKPIYATGNKLNFVLRVGTHQKDGSIQISQSHANADPKRPPKYMVREDLLITSLYHQRLRLHEVWGNLPLEGPDWEDLLEAAAATGRMFYGIESYASGNEALGYQPVNLGPPMKIHATWEVSADGGARPMLQCDSPEIVILPTEPPRYFDPASMTLGMVESALPSQLLKTWQDGPSVSADLIETVTARVSAIAAMDLPVPKTLETEARPACKPAPHLRVYTRVLGGKWDKRPYIVGEIKFRYADSPLLLPLAKRQTESHAELVDGKRVVWHRDFKDEQLQARRLMSLGFIAVSEQIRPEVLDDAALFSCVPEDLEPSPRFAWLRLLHGPEMQTLRDSGWTIEVDANAGLTVHQIDQFMPTIEADSEHGIDWFRFDATIELNGKPVSLIPIIADGLLQDLPASDAPDLPEFITLQCEDPADGFMHFPAKRLLELIEQVRHLFHGNAGTGPIRMDRLAAAGVASALEIDSSETTQALAKLGRRLQDITDLPLAEVPHGVCADLRTYQLDGYRWLQFLAANGLNGILADDMGLGKTLQALTHLAAECAKRPGLPSLVIAPTSVVPNWASEAARFTPHLKVVVLQGKDRTGAFGDVSTADVVFTSYPLLTRDFEELKNQPWHLLILDEAQYIKNPKAVTSQHACQLTSAHRICLSGTPMENHLGELWSLMRFLMPGFLSDEKTFNSQLRRPIERTRCSDAQLALNRRVSPLILRRTKDQVASELPPKTEILHGIDLTKKQSDLYESVRAAMDQRVRDAIAARGLAKSHIIVLDALLKLRQICCHPQLLKTPSAQKIKESAKLDYLVRELLPTLIEEGRRILLFSSFTSMLALIEDHLRQTKIPYLKLTGQTKERATLVEKFQSGTIPIFLISLKAGGTGLNLTAADTVIHYDPWWNPAAENQATDRAHRIGQTKPVFVHKLVCRGTIEDRILELQKHKASLVEALLSEETTKLKVDAETLSHLFAPLG